MIIKKGDKFECIKDVIMDNNPKDIAYTSGKIYISELNGCITDDQNKVNHYWSNEESEQYFIKLPKSKKEMVNHPSHYNRNYRFGMDWGCNGDGVQYESGCI